MGTNKNTNFMGWCFCVGALALADAITTTKKVVTIASVKRNRPTDD